MAVLDLNKPPHVFNQGLQLNLLKLYELYAPSFKIKYKKTLIEANIVYRKLTNGVKFLNIFNGDKTRDFLLRPFSIDFVDAVKAEFNNNVYIANIHKIENISGSEMVNMCIALCKLLGAHTIQIGDGAKIECNKEEYDLSFLKLIETRKTFYMRFGFENDINNAYHRFKNIQDLKRVRNEIIDNIRSVKTSDIIAEYSNTLAILSKCIIEDGGDRFNVFLSDSDLVEKDNFYRKSDAASYKHMSDLFTECYEMLSLLRNYSSYKLLWKLMVYLFSSDCENYGLIEKYIIKNTRSEIRYGGKVVKRYYVNDFIILRKLRYSLYVLRLK
jgi:hypothetical protein